MKRSAGANLPTDHIRSSCRTRSGQRQSGPHPGALSVLALALAAALAAPRAGAVEISADGNTRIDWSSGDLLIDTGVQVSVTGDYAAQAAAGAGSLLGTLYNAGTLNGSTAGLNVDVGQTVQQVANTIGATIIGGSNGIANAGLIQTLNNQGFIGDSNMVTISGVFNAVGGTINNIVNSGTISSVNSNVSVANDAGIYNGGAVGTLSNSGLISGFYDGIINGYSTISSGSIGSLINNSGGTIYATPYSGTAIANFGVIDTISNSGLVSGGWMALDNESIVHLLTNTQGGTLYADQTGIVNTGTIDSLVNAGVIEAALAVKNFIYTISTLTNSDTGLISGGNIAVENVGGYLGLLSNAGTITGGSIGVNNLVYSVSAHFIVHGSLATLANSGLIYGGVSGVQVADATGTILNDGTIYSPGHGIDVVPGYSLNGFSSFHSSLASLVNSGLIDGGVAGVYSSESIGSILNSGTITSTGDAIHIASGSAASGISLQATLSSLSNTGLIYGTGNAIYSAGLISSISNNASIDNGTLTSGTIASAGNAIDIASGGTLGGLSNAGLISGGVNAIYSAGQIDSISNSGTIYSTGNAVDIVSGGTLSNLSNAGLIYGGANAIYSAGQIDSISNSGTIYSTGNAVDIVSGGTLSNLSNAGLISGSANAIYSAGQIDSISNSSTITSTGNAIDIASTGSLGNVSNTGLIYGGGNAIYSAGQIGSIVNSSTINSPGNAINIASGGSLSGLSNGGLIAGKIIDMDTADLTITGIGNNVGTLTGYNGTIGSIVTQGNLVFASGTQLLNDNVTVNGGNGTLTNAAGILQVNNVLTITGSYEQNAAATLIIGVGSNATAAGLSSDIGYGRLVVLGDASVEAGSSITLSKLTRYNYAVGQRFVVIQAAGSTDYNAASLNFSGSGYTANGLDMSETIGGTTYHDLVMTITGVLNGNLSTNANANAALTGLSNYTGLNQSLLDLFNPAQAFDNASQANHAGAQLSPAATRNALMATSTTAFDAVQNATFQHIDSVRTAQADGTSGVATGESTLAPALWGRFFGGQANQGQRDGISGYHANYGGLMLGGDLQASANWRTGGVFSYGHTSIGNDGDNSGSSAAVDTVGLMAYAGYDGQPWYLNLAAGVARQQNSSTRAVSFTGFDGTASGNFSGMLYTATAQAGYPLQWGNATVTPLLALGMSALRQNGYTESGSSAALAVNASSSTSLKSQLGAKYELSLQTHDGELRPFVQLGWNHEFHNTPLTTSAIFAADTSGTTAFTTQGATPLRNTAQLAVGATLLRGKNLSVTARYTIEGGSAYTAQTADVSLRWQY